MKRMLIIVPADTKCAEMFEQFVAPMPGSKFVSGTMICDAVVESDFDMSTLSYEILVCVDFDETVYKQLNEIKYKTYIPNGALIETNMWGGWLPGIIFKKEN